MTDAQIYRQIERWVSYALEHESVGNFDIANLFWAKIEAAVEKLEGSYVGIVDVG